MNNITDVTREEIFRIIKYGIVVTNEIERLDSYERIYYDEEYEKINMPYYGKMEYIKFFNRIYNLNEIESTDSRFENAGGDIYQHTMSNDDWEWDWFIDYSPFELENGSDEKLLKFISEIFHPAVRDEKQKWKEYLKRFNELLKYDGYEIFVESKVSGRDVYSYRKISCGNSHVLESVQIINESFSSEYIKNQVDIMLSSINDNPADAIGKAKELLESCCKTILDGEDIIIENNWNVQRLAKETAKVLKLTPNDVDDHKKARDTIKQILGSLSAISSGIAELRNSYGSGHGKKSKFKGLTSRHANLAVGASVTAVRFFWDTYKEQQK